MEFLLRPWPWYVAGPLLGLVAPLLLLLGNRAFGMSSNFRHVCAAVLPGRVPFFCYDWRREGGWNLAFAAGVIAGGFIGGWLLANPEPVAISAAARDSLAQLGIRDFTGLVPTEIFAATAALQPRNLALLLVGGLFIGFGTAWAGGCTSGHAITGVADLQPASFLALAGFFIGGLAGTLLILPWFLGA